MDTLLPQLPLLDTLLLLLPLLDMLVPLWPVLSFKKPIFSFKRTKSDIRVDCTPCAVSDFS